MTLKTEAVFNKKDSKGKAFEEEALFGPKDKYKNFISLLNRKGKRIESKDGKVVTYVLKRTISQHVVYIQAVVPPEDNKLRKKHRPQIKVSIRVKKGQGLKIDEVGSGKTYLAALAFSLKRIMLTVKELLNSKKRKERRLGRIGVRLLKLLAFGDEPTQVAVKKMELELRDNRNWSGDHDDGDGDGGEGGDDMDGMDGMVMGSLRKRNK